MRETRPLVTAAGELELDRWPPGVNLAEGLGVYALALLAVWGGGRRAGHAALVGLVLYALLLAPWLHGDTAASRGLSPPAGLVRHWRGLDAAGRQRLRLALLALAAALALASARGWPNLLARLGIRRHFRVAFEALTAAPTSAWLGALVGLLLVFPLALLGIRWDNLAPALRRLLPLAALLAGGTALLAAGHAVHSGSWERLAPATWLAPHADRTSPVFYLLWGFAQQWLFLGYFNGRLRKGIPARGLGPFPGRLLAALLTGAFFAGAHLPALELAALSFATGSLLAWYFQADRTRNLFAMGLLHATAGTLFSLWLPVSMDVGPWTD